MPLGPYHTLQLSFDDRVLTVRFNRPDRLNAIDGRMHTELSRIFAEIASEPSVDAVLLTGSGRAFCAGGDIDFFRGVTDPELNQILVEAPRIIHDFLHMPQPVVAAVNGPATGLGCTLALFCDIVVAATDAKMGDPHVSLGLVAGDGAAIIWPWLIGPARAKQYLMTGDLLTGSEAAAIGLVNFAVPGEAVLDVAGKWVRRLADGPRDAVRGTKASINLILRHTVDQVLPASLAMEAPGFHSEDHRAALRASAVRQRPQKP